MLSYTTPPATMQQVLLKHHAAPASGANNHVQKVLQRLKTCRTASLGYHVYRCSNEDCGQLKYQYHSCRDRHCPQCGALKKDEWIEARMQELLPVKYYHVVFTLPHELNSLVMGHRKVLYKLLFDASAQTLLSFASDPKYLGATPGIISVLHTWGQQLSFHPHIHCIVSGGGITGSNEWKQATKNDWRFLFPVKAMGIVYRAKFLQALKAMIEAGEVILPQTTDAKQLFNLLYSKQWLVYAKAPFGGPYAVIEYLGRYTHKIAITAHRIRAISEHSVSFTYKDYTDGSKQKDMTLSHAEFLRRFELHILPKRFVKIRHYGLLQNHNKTTRLNAIREQLQLSPLPPKVQVPVSSRMLEKFGKDITLCPKCKSGKLLLIHIDYGCDETKPVKLRLTITNTNSITDAPP